MRVNFVISDDKASKIFVDIFRRFMDSGRVNVVVSNTPAPDCDIYHYHRAQIADDIRPKSVITVHHDIDDPDPFVHISRFLPKFRAAKVVICLNSCQQKRLDDFGIKHTVRIPHGFDHSMLRKKPLRGFDPNRKLTLGIISKRYSRRVKGEAYLHGLLDRLDPRKFSFLLVGEGRAEDAAHMRQLGFSVSVFDTLPYRLFQKAYEAIDALLMMSPYEGGPANIPEAIATGTPVFSSPIGLARDMVTDGANGVFLTGNPNRDAHALFRFANNDGQLYDRLVQGAHELTPCPTWDGVIAAHIRLYDQIIKSQPTLQSDAMLLDNAALTEPKLLSTMSR